MKIYLGKDKQNKDLKPIVFKLKSVDWKAGTTHTYKIGERWKYDITTANPILLEYNATNATANVTSIKRKPDGTIAPVKWKVVEYSVDGGKQWTDKKPEWVTNITPTDGHSATTTEIKATLKVNEMDLLKRMNEILKNAKEVSNFDLSLSEQGKENTRNTANCYIVKAPGTYKIPLVYGNAIKNGSEDKSVFTSTLKCNNFWRDLILDKFIDHAGKPIDNAWINATNKGANKPDGAKLIWTDCAGAVEENSLKVDTDGKFLSFTVSKEKLQNGNAVIAVTKNGTVVWSWHLWFASDDILGTVKTIGAENKQHTLAQYPLGMHVKTWKGEPNNREVKIKVKQEESNKESVITLIQKRGFGKFDAEATVYQFGRKDALPTEQKIQSVVHGKSNFTIENTIKNPFTFYGDTQKEGKGVKEEDWKIMWRSVNMGAYNLWAKDCKQNETGKTVKTIYDPCPYGYKVPELNAFALFDEVKRGDIYIEIYQKSNPKNNLIIPYTHKCQKASGDAIEKGKSYNSAYWTGLAVDDWRAKAFAAEHNPQFGLGTNNWLKTMGLPILPMKEE